MESLENQYTQITYSQEQRAYIIPGNHLSARKLEFALGFKIADEDPVPVSIVNPVFVVKNWGTKAVEVKVDGKKVEKGKNLRIGYEKTASGSDLILWLKLTSDKTLSFSLIPGQ